MKTEILHQFPGKQNLNEQLIKALKDDSCTQLRIIVAYISWYGIRPMHRELEKFHDAGKKVSIIIGVGGGRSESEGIKYLIERLYNADLFIFHAPSPNFTFHPKIYIFSNDSKRLVFIGSNNFTMGGLFCNCECAVKLSLNYKSDKKYWKEINAIWGSYLKPLKPFKKGNLKKITSKLLYAYSKEIETAQKTYKKSSKPILKKLFPAVQIIRPPVPPVEKRVSKKKVGKILLLEILKETGARGTQVQVPRRVIDYYFDAPVKGYQTIELKFGYERVRPAVICHFPNKTHRISFHELGGLRRPLLMKFNESGENRYSVKLITGKEYKKLIKKCTNQTRSGARRWGILKKL